jgi:O-acetyl-ADP-ribose deacetylase (regulator of RNase III)
MIEYRVGDIFDQLDLTHIAHQSNLYCTFGSGIAAVIKKKYPEAFAADCATKHGDMSKLGTFSMAFADDGKTVINLYAQIGIDSKHRTTSYDAMCKGLTELNRYLLNLNSPIVLGIPYKIGCGLAGGSWIIVESIIRDVFEKSSVKVVICQREQDK